MASNIGRWSAQASLDTTGFTSGVQRMQNSIRGFVQGPGGLGMLTNAGAALGIMSISSAFSNLRQTLEDEIDLAFLNDQLGTTLEWLSRLRTVASENSISQDQFSAAVQRFNQVMGQARLGSSEALRTFDSLGLSMQQMSGRGFEENFTTVADALSRIEDRTVRARLAMELFGRTGGGNVLRMVEDIEKRMKDVQDRGGFVTPEMNERFQELNTAIDKATTTWNNAWRTFLSDIAPAISAFINRWTEMISRPRWFQLLRLSVPQAGLGEEIFDALPSSWQGRLEQTWDQAMVAMQGMLEGRLLTIDEINERLFQQTAPQGALPAMPQGEDLGGTGFGSFLQNLEEQVREAFGGIAEAARLVADAQREAAQIIEQTQSPMQRFQTEFSNFDRLLQMNQLTQEQFSRAVGLSFERLTQGLGGGSMEIGSLDAGSAEVAAIIANASNPQVDVLNTILAVQQNELEQQARFAEIAEQIRGLLERQNEFIGEDRPRL